MGSPYLGSARCSCGWELFPPCSSEWFVVVAVEVLAAGRPLLSRWSSLLIQQLCLTFVLRHFGTSVLLICGRVAL